MDIASKVKLGANSVKGRNIDDYTDVEIRQARKEVAAFFKVTGQDVERLKTTADGRNSIRRLIFETLESNRVTPEEYKAKKEAAIKAGKERFKARMAEEAKKEAIEAAKTPAQKAMDKKINDVKQLIDLWLEELEKAKDEAEYDKAEKRIAELKAELANLKA
jgi:hypothetical protein